jgi:hypothetical protein
MPSYHGDGLSLAPLETPAAPTLTVRGTTGETTYGYKVVAIRGDGHTAASSAATTGDGNATLSGNNRVEITPPYVQGAASYHIYRTTGGATQGKIGSLTPKVVGSTQTAVFRDTGKVAEEGEEPDTNTTGQLTASGIVMLTGLPTADPEVLGQLWNDSGTLKISAGD